MLYIDSIDSANPTWTGRVPAFYLSFECCQSCIVFYFLRYGIPNLGPRYDTDCLPYVSVLTWSTDQLMSKIIMILRKKKILTN